MGFSRFVAAGVLATAGLAASAFGDASALNLLIPFDSNNPVGTGWTQSMAPNDDGSSGLIDIGFTYCFYNQGRTQLYINNNGNVSFSGPFTSFTSTGFPVNGFDMVAPFWADVDTRNQTDNPDTNLVWHRQIDLNSDGAADLFAVTWDSVGWYSGQNGQRNTFQLLISADPNFFGANLNTAFSYGRMDWTTGQASGGGPFGGTPATVGANRGNGVDFSQLGRFDHAGADWDGAFGNNDGVDFLENRAFFFDGCAGDVPAPGAAALLGLGGLLAARRRRA
ncbi:MAG: nidogen-like domain-containing protein [Phycisphaerales bacterium]